LILYYTLRYFITTTYDYNKRHDINSILTFFLNKFIWKFSLLLQEDCNVMCVDWSSGAKDPNYVRAAVNTRLVGKLVSLLVENVNAAMETR